ncbi:hypothetical protein FRX31_015545 [Thalictrum thalictroides]|uniref:Uncharacterized protein n=1 Tax=Thalictrum thalictroides TaxID=46969 RepID=A0A7J6WDC2_THATH|nr:hypothetical protein FRX31_015545 [Thalictrum thalictroides]
MGKRKRDSISTDLVLQICFGDCPLGTRRIIQRLNRQKRMDVLRDRRASTGIAITPSQSNPIRMQTSQARTQYRRIQSNPYPVAVRARRALFQDPVLIGPSTSRGIEINERDMFPLCGSGDYYFI